MFTLPRGPSKIVRGLLKEYYERAQLMLPFDVELREFAYQPLDGGSYVRHISLQNEAEVRQMATREIPGHLFYSSAKYQRPAARDMEEKGWMGSDLQFDIDADHLCQVRRIVFCPICGEEVTGDRCPRDGTESMEYVEITQDCLEKALEQATTLTDILKDDFGLIPRLFFSGNRGFHVLVECSGECALMDSEDRREVVKYVTGDGVPDYRGSLQDPGWPGRQARGVKGVQVDEQVTVDVRRLVRIPGSVHGKSSLLVKEVTGEFRLDQGLSPFTGSAIVLPYLSGEFLLIDRTFRLERGVPLKLDASYGMFAWAKGLGEVTFYVR